MKTSTLFLGAFLASSVMALPYANLEIRQDPTAANVTAAINLWTQDITVVNTLVDTFPTSNTVNVSAALKSAQNELVVFQGVLGVRLYATGVNAAMEVATEISLIITSLEDMINNPGSTAVEQVVILTTLCVGTPYVSAYWNAIAAATGAPSPAPAIAPAACNNFKNPF